MDEEMQLKEAAVVTNPDDPTAHYNLGLFLWERKDSKEKAAEHFVIAAKLNPQDANAFRYLGHYYSKVSVDNQRALKCYQRAINLAPQDSESGLQTIFSDGPARCIQVSMNPCIYETTG
nr:tetratricopeptide repeat protein SKI3 [Tanacetum cinerariifolium]